MTAWKRSLPAIDVDSAPYWDACREGRLLVQRCRDCGRYQHLYRKDFCSHCWSREVDDVVSSGKGTVWTFTVTHVNRTPGFAEEVPYVLALIELEEGVKMMSNLIGCDPDSVRIGMPVRVTFTKATDTISIPFFEPA